MKGKRHAVVLIGLSVVLLFPHESGEAHEPHRCPNTLPGDVPALSGHVRQEDIVRGVMSFQQVFDAGQKLFEAVFNKCDGQGRPAATGADMPVKRTPGSAPEFTRTSAPDANSCAGCHNQPRSGGAGDTVANVFVLAQTLDPVTSSISAEFSNERNTLGMMGSGAIELLAREMTADLHSIRGAAIAQAMALGKPVTRLLETKGVNFGKITARPDGTLETSMVEGIDPDLVVKPLHAKGAVRSLREFTVKAMNHHHGMQPVERFGIGQTGTSDFDEDGIPDELTTGDITAVTVFQAGLNIPGLMVKDFSRIPAMINGYTHFLAIGCADCHKPFLTLNNPVFCEPNPLSPPGTFNEVESSFCFDLTKDGPAPRLVRSPDGTVKVMAFTDLKRHRICDRALPHFCNEKLVQAGVPTDQFITRKLWDAGNSAPYGHRGDLTTFTEAILNHGGEGRAAGEAFLRLSVEEQAEIVEFLKALQVLPNGSERLVIQNPSRVFWAKEAELVNLLRKALQMP